MSNGEDETIFRGLMLSTCMPFKPSEPAETRRNYTDQSVRGQRPKHSLTDDTGNSPRANEVPASDGKSRSRVSPTTLETRVQKDGLKGHFSGDSDTEQRLLIRGPPWTRCNPHHLAQEQFQKILLLQHPERDAVEGFIHVSVHWSDGCGKLDGR